MSGSSSIGALRVDLGLDSAQFTRGLDQMQLKLKQFGQVAKASMFALAGVTATAATAFGVAAKSTIDHADALSKLSQKVGVSVEALSKLEYAGKFADVSLDDLGGSLTKLSKAMGDAAGTSAGPAAGAFAALGVKVTDAAGNLRTADAVFTDIAGSFARLQDGATKTNLALTLFGKSGTDVIPLLNSGAAGLKAMGDEAANTGNVISTKFAGASEAFNDALTKVSTNLAGVVTTVVGSDGVTQALGSLANTLASPEFAAGAERIATSIVAAMDAIGGKVGWVTEMFVNFGNELRFVAEQAQKIPFLGLNVGATVGGVRIGPDVYSTNNRGAKASGTDAMFPTSDDIGAGPGSFGDFGAMTGQLGAGKSTFDFRAAFGEATKPIDDTSKSLDTLTSKLGAVAGAAAAGAGSMADGFSLVKQSSLDMAEGTLGSLASITSSLSAAFGDNKELAAASAAINVAQGVTKAFAEGGPLGFLEGAAIAAAGAVQITNILSTAPGSAKVTSPTGPSVAAGASASAVAPQAINVTLRGSIFSGGDVENLLRQITDHLNDGGSRSFKLAVAR